jgi:hypothetical protein
MILYHSAYLQQAEDNMNVPFTTEEFFNVIKNYNVAVFPIQLILILAGIFTVTLMHSKSSLKNLLAGGFLGILWIWTGIVYHLVFFTVINKAAYFFGGLFILQGVLFLFDTFLRKKLEFEFKVQSKDYIAYFFIVFGLIFYPVLIYFLENSPQTTITLGLPCPSTIFTFGLLMLTNVKFSKYLLIIPSIWAVIGTSAAFNFGVYPDYLMIISAIIANYFLIRRKRIRE